MEMTKELIEKAKKCETVQELLALAKENEVELTEEMAEGLLARFKKPGEVSDEELDNVAGGGCDFFKEKCPKCKSTNVKLLETKGHSSHLKCRECGYEWHAVLKFG